jgi:hypothetical protein
MYGTLHPNAFIEDPLMNCMLYVYMCTLFLLCNQSMKSDYFTDIDKILEYKSDAHFIAYVKNKYERTFEGIDYLFYPAHHTKRLYIFCNGATVGKYTMWSWFWQDDEAWDETAYLFLKDDTIRWYLGTIEAPLTETYCALIRSVIAQCGITEKQTYTIGHSMGGYAAIHFALRLGLGGVFALRPQIDWEYGTQFFSIKKLKGLWVDLDQHLLQSPCVPRAYLQFGEFGPDKGAGLKFLNALIEKHAFVILEKTNNASHTGYHPTKEHIESTLTYLETIRTSINQPSDCLPEK